MDGMRRPLQILAASVGAVFLIGAGACAVRTDRSESADPPAAAEQAEPQSEGAWARHHDRRFKGPARLVLDAALEHGDLSVVQEEVVRDIAAELEIDEETKREMHDKLKASALEVVRAGSTDSAELEQAVDNATEAIEERMEMGADALKELHATLDADQRAAVAEALRQRMAERWGHHHHHGKRHKRFKQIAAYLMLSTYQVDKLKSVRQQLLGKPKRLRPTPEELRQLNDAFEGEDFGELLDQFQAGKIEILRERIASAGEHTDTVLSLLTDGQRVLLADLIERGPREVLVGERGERAEAD